MKVNKKIKKFDAVKLMREIREKFSREIMNMTYEEEREFLDKQLKSKNQIREKKYLYKSKT